MASRLFLLFVITPIVELALLIRLGEAIGFWPTFALVVFTGLLGSTMAKQQGLSVWQKFNARLGSGSLPGTELMDGIIILISGAFLLTPGVLTDVIGFMGLFPVSRAWIRKLGMRWIKSAQERGAIRMNVSFNAPFEPPSASGPQDRPAAEPQWQGQGRTKPTHASDSES